MPDRDFRFTYDSSHHRVYLLTCRKCGTKDGAGPTGPNATLPPEAITKIMYRRGWVVGRNDRTDICPACAKVVRKVVSFPTPNVEGAPMPLSLPSKPAAVPERTMSREDRRIIYGQLDAVYPGEKQGYHVGWNDAKVATDLGVPPAWVAQVREEMFGPEHSAPTKALIDAITTAATEARSHLAEVDRIKADIEAKIAALETRAKAIAA